MSSMVHARELRERWKDQLGEKLYAELVYEVLDSMGGEWEWAEERGDSFAIFQYGTFYSEYVDVYPITMLCTTCSGLCSILFDPSGEENIHAYDEATVLIFPDCEACALATVGELIWALENIEKDYNRKDSNNE